MFPEVASSAISKSLFFIDKETKHAKQKSIFVTQAETFRDEVMVQILDLLGFEQ